MKKKIFFSILSAFYILGIFYFAGSRIVSQLSFFNPYSLLHIPLYGVLTLFLILALGPAHKINSHFRYLPAASIALGVAIADETHQLYVPGREGSITDVLLDFGGILLAIFLIQYLSRRSP